jgi:hypothetical protein
MCCQSPPRTARTPGCVPSSHWTDAGLRVPMKTANTKEAVIPTWCKHRAYLGNDFQSSRRTWSINDCLGPPSQPSYPDYLPRARKPREGVMVGRPSRKVIHLMWRASQRLKLTVVFSRLQKGSRFNRLITSNISRLCPFCRMGFRNKIFLKCQSSH